MNDIRNTEYAAYLEKTLRELIEIPVEGICIITKMEGGGVFTSYYNSSMMDKITYAGVIQQDAMLDMLKANNLVKEDRRDGEEE